MKVFFIFFQPICSLWTPSPVPLNAVANFNAEMHFSTTLKMVVIVMQHLLALSYLFLVERWIPPCSFSFIIMHNIYSTRVKIIWFYLNFCESNLNPWIVELDRVYPNSKTRRVLAIFSNPNPKKNPILRLPKPKLEKNP